MRLKSTIRRCFIILFLFMPFFISASEKIVLDINDMVQSVNEQYTLQELQQLPQQEISIQLPWTDQPYTYKGPYLEDVFEHAGVEGRWLTLHGVDNYKISYSYPSIEKYKPILALQADGNLLSIRSKGPIMLILPIDQYKELNTLVYHDYMVWHLMKIDISNKE